MAWLAAFGRTTNDINARGSVENLSRQLVLIYDLCQDGAGRQNDAHAACGAPGRQRSSPVGSPTIVHRSASVAHRLCTPAFTFARVCGTVFSLFSLASHRYRLTGAHTRVAAAFA